MIIGCDYSNGKDYTTLQVVNVKDLNIGDEVIVDGSWNVNYAYHGKYKVLYKYCYNDIPMVNLIKYEE